jgi:hypothetical protein
VRRGLAWMVGGRRHVDDSFDELRLLQHRHRRIALLELVATQPVTGDQFGQCLLTLPSPTAPWMTWKTDAPQPVPDSARAMVRRARAVLWLTVLQSCLVGWCVWVALASRQMNLTIRSESGQALQCRGGMEGGIHLAALESGQGLAIQPAVESVSVRRRSVTYVPGQKCYPCAGLHRGV